LYYKGEGITAGKLSKDKAAELQALLDEALSLYKEGNCYEAVRNRDPVVYHLPHPAVIGILVK